MMGIVLLFNGILAGYAFSAHMSERFDVLSGHGSSMCRSFEEFESNFPDLLALRTGRRSMNTKYLAEFEVPVVVKEGVFDTALIRFCFASYQFLVSSQSSFRKLGESLVKDSGNIESSLVSHSSFVNPLISFDFYRNDSDLKRLRSKVEYFDETIPTISRIVSLMLSYINLSLGVSSNIQLYMILVSEYLALYNWLLTRSFILKYYLNISMHVHEIIKFHIYSSSNGSSSLGNSVISTPVDVSFANAQSAANSIESYLALIPDKSTDVPPYPMEQIVSFFASITEYIRNSLVLFFQRENENRRRYYKQAHHSPSRRSKHASSETSPYTRISGHEASHSIINRVWFVTLPLYDAIMGENATARVELETRALNRLKELHKDIFITFPNRINRICKSEMDTSLKDIDYHINELLK